MRVPHTVHKAQDLIKIIISGGFVSNVLQEVSVPILTNANCAEVYGDWITSNMICAGKKEGGKDACQVGITDVQ